MQEPDTCLEHKASLNNAAHVRLTCWGQMGQMNKPEVTEVAHRLIRASTIPHLWPTYPISCETNNREQWGIYLEDVTDKPETVARPTFMCSGYTFIEFGTIAAAGNLMDCVQNRNHVFQSFYCHHNLPMCQLRQAQERHCISQRQTAYPANTTKFPMRFTGHLPIQLFWCSRDIRQN